MFYTIYEVTNTLNGKKYIGKHVTDDLNDNYMGSGKILRRAIEKYGRDVFTKEVLFVFDNEQDMNLKEIELITPEVVLSENYYNIAYGGQGGVIVLKPDHPLYEQTRRKMSAAQQARSADISRITTENHKRRKVGMYGKSQSDHQKQVASKTMKGKQKSPEAVAKQRESIIATLNAPGYVHPNKGKTRGPGHKEKMSKIIRSRLPKTCPYCDKTLDVCNYARYHGDKCRHKGGNNVQTIETIAVTSSRC